MGAGYLNQANHESIAVAWVSAQASALKIFPSLGMLQEPPISMPPISWRRTTIPACDMRPVVSSSAVRSKQMSTTLASYSSTGGKQAACRMLFWRRLILPK